MRGGIDAARQARDDGEIVLAKLERDVAREPLAVGRGVARTDDRDSATFRQRQVAARREKRRRIFDGGEGRGILRLAPRDHLGAGALHRGHFLQRIGAGRHVERA